MEKDVNTSLDEFMSSDELPVIKKNEQPKVVEQKVPTTTPTQNTNIPKLVIPEMDENFTPELNDMSPKEREEMYGVKIPKEMKGKRLKVVGWEFTKPKVKDSKRQPIPPIVSTKTKDLPPEKQTKYYPAKLVVKFEENFVDYYPSVNYWVNKREDEQGNKVEFINPRIEIHREGHSVISQLLRRIIVKMSGDKLKLTTVKINKEEVVIPAPDNVKEYEEFQKNYKDKEILDWLIGKYVLIDMEEGVYESRAWYRSIIIPE